MARPRPPETVRLMLAVGGERPPGIAAICRAIDEAGLPAGPWRGFRRRYVGWDGPDGELARAGLRLETVGSGRAARALLTIASGPALHRSVVLPTIGSPPPLDDLVKAAGLPGRGHGALRETFGRSVAGRTCPAAAEGATITVETATWQRDGMAWRQHQLVLEAPAGSGADLLAAARPLADRLALRLVDERPERAADWHLGGVPPPFARVPSENLGAAETAAGAFLVIGRAGLRQVLANLELLAHVPAPEAVHRLRVGLRRLRAALTLFRDCLDPEARRSLAAELKWMNGVFAGTRDWDVFAAETLGPIRQAMGPGFDLSAAAAAVEQRRTAARAAMAQALYDPRLTRTMLDLVVWLELGRAPATGARAGDPVRKFARRLLSRGRRRLLAHFAEARPTTPAEWHALRIEAKKLRYATDAFGALYPRETALPFLRALQEVQDCLGRYNDAAVADGLSRGLDDVATAALVAGWTAHARLEQERRFEAAWKKFRKRRPFWRRD
ncbi:hypothetical protein STVA_29890 [Allostella vacuolata]|nr:hypothetical protein STVA_29890 [Stella vacuolata]